MKRERKDITWEEILKKLTDDGIEKTIRYKEEYLEAMRTLCIKILSMKNEENMDVFKRPLYDLASMFYLFDLRMKKYNEYAKEHDIPEVLYEWCEIPGNHNFNAYLRYLNRELLDKYYLKMVDSILEYIENKAEKLPDHMYLIISSLENGKRSFYIIKQALIRTIGLEDESELYLPGYYPINEKIELDKEKYRELFYQKLKWNQEESYQRFLKNEYPIYEYIMKNLYKGEKDETYYFK